MKRYFPSKFGSLLEVVDYFKTEKICNDWLVYRRWQGKISCPHCEGCKIYTFSDGKRYKCAGCLKQFNVRTASILEDSKLPLRKWVMALYFLLSDKKGISSYQLANHLRVTQKTAWFMLQRLRWMLKQEAETKMTGVVQSDETFVGGKNKNRHKNKRVKNSMGRSFKDKTPVIGLLSNTGELRAFVIPNTGPKIIEPIMYHNIQEGAKVITDDWCAYGMMRTRFEHHVIDHGKYQYVNEHGTTNAIECYWSHFKRGIFGVYHHVTPKHLQRYIDESVFRYNTKDVTDGERLVMAIDRMAGKRLTYKQLIGKA